MGKTPTRKWEVSIPIDSVKYLDLFDDIKYKIVKELLDTDGFCLEAVLELSKPYRRGYTKVIITFDIDYDYETKVYKRVLQYGNGSPMSQVISDIVEEAQEIKEEEED